MAPRKKPTVAVPLVALMAIQPPQSRSFPLNWHLHSGATKRGRQRLPFFRPRSSPSPPFYNNYNVLGVLQKKNEWRLSPPAAFLTTLWMNGEDGSFSLTTFVERLVQTVSRPTPGLSTMAFGFPLLLAVAFIGLPFSTWLWLTTVFAGGAFLGRRLQDEEDGVILHSPLENSKSDDNDETPSLVLADGLALGAAIVAAGLFGNGESSSLLSNVNLSYIVDLEGLLWPWLYYF